MMPEDWDPIAAFTRGDPLRAEALRANLTRIAEQTDQPEVRRLVQEVLDGRRTVRELVREPAMVAELDRGMDAFARQWSDLSPEQRAALVNQGIAEEDQRRLAAGLPPTREPEARPGDNPLLRED
ncbi:hypothetical protein [Nocardioides daejeonensis]|uniref:hypothetical protein n=1 Tax=Nocardioides daejeonensis TaxID=1046556 RepID=UPI000D746996|nr:hypothetical protein [Nocardioides daejeonensis]